MDNAFFRAVTTFGYVWWLHILWLVCSLPVVTIGASTTALCYSCMKLRKREGYVTGNFFRSFKENFRQATGIFLVYLLVGAVILFNICIGRVIIIPFWNVVRGVTYVLILPYFLTFIYVFAVQARFNNKIVDTIKYSFWLACRYLGDTVQMLLLVGIVVGLNLTIVLANFVTLSMGIGITVFLLAAYYNRIFDKILCRVNA